MSTKGYYPPVRPPRGSKVSKDTNGLLMNIIAELSVRSKSEGERKRKLEELKKDYLSSDSRLLKLISGQRDQLIVIMEAFSKISAKINTSRRGVCNVREKLKAAKTLLECKRNDIKRLWTESVEHQGVISILKEIDDLHQVNDKIEDLLKEHQFLKATQMLVSSLSLLENKLSEADALKDLKHELNFLKKKLHLIFVEEILQNIYESPSQMFLKKASGGDEKESCTKSYDELFNRKNCVVKLPIEGSGGYDASSLHCSNYEEIATLLECLTLLQTLPETVDIIKDNCSKALTRIIENCTEVMCDSIQQGVHYSNADRENSKDEEPLYHLKDLLTEILNEFRQVALNHYILLDNVERISMTKNLTDVSHYEMADIYSRIQAAIELWVSDFLDLHNTVSTERIADFSTHSVPTNISSYFLRKGNTRTKRKPNTLFKFDSSSHAINKKNYLREQREKDSIKEKAELESAETDRSYLITSPNVKNIKILYKPLKQFVCDIKVALRLENVDQCPLHTFLFDAVKIFLEQVNMDINRLIERSSISLDSWKPVTDHDELQSAKAKAPQILNSTLAVNSCLKELEELIYALPDYSSHFLQLMVNVLQNYSDLCHGAYKSLIYAFGDLEEQKIFSVSWARDSDISRLLKSLPNWVNLEVNCISEDVHLDYEESPEEIHFRNKAESDLLIRNLSCKETISPSEIILEHEKLANLALMHESMEWFSSSIMGFADRLPDVQASIQSLYTPEKLDEIEANIDIAVGISTKGCLKKLAQEFEDLASTCLLVLHLEVRAHCFFYLLQLYKGSSYISRKDDEEPEPEVLKLNRDLSKIDESLSPVLQPKKMRYIFEGLGELLSTILINCVSNVKKINENGVKKMGRNIFSIQQNLATITMTREVALDRARQYFDLLNHSYEDILNQIMEEGPQFQEHEYSAIIQLLHNSREGIYEQESLTYYLEKLRQILDEVAVSV